MSTTRTSMVDLGWCIGRLTVENGRSISLTVISPADTSAERYAPAESVCIYGRDGLIALRDFLTAALLADEGTI